MGRAEDLFGKLNENGMEAVRDLFAQKQNEDAFLDFKRSSDHGANPSLSNEDRNSLAKSLSGFANTDGGVVVWGVGSGGSKGEDFASEQKPLQNCRRFAALLDGAISALTAPPVTGVRSIPIFDGVTETSGYVATLIPASSGGPHQLQSDGRYLMRIGSGFKHVPHVLLAGMFGVKRPPSLAVELMHPTLSSSAVDLEGLILDADLTVLNRSPIFGKEVYVAWEIYEWEYVHGQVEVALKHERISTREETWEFYSSHSTLGGTACLQIEERLPPFTSSFVGEFSVIFRKPFPEELTINFVVGCEGSMPKRQKLVWTKAHLEEAFERRKDVNRPRNRLVELDFALKFIASLLP